MQIFRQRYWRLLPLVPFLAAFAVYFQTTDFSYVWDDNGLLLSSPSLRSWDLLWAAIGKGFLNYQTYFRPLPLLSLGLEQLLFDGAAFASHFISMLVFSVNCGLLAALAAVVAEQRQLPVRPAWLLGLLTGALYALHPALIESVTWISCRFDLMLTFFCLLMLLADRLIRPQGLRAGAVGVLFLLAALCKEMAVGLAVVLPLWHLAFAPAQARGNTLMRWHVSNGHWLTYLAVFVAGCCYLLLRKLSMPQFYQLTDTMFERGSVQHLLCVLQSAGAYLHFSFWPFIGLGPTHTLYVPLSWTAPKVLLGMSLVLVSLAVFSKALLKGYRGAACFLPMFALCLLPVLNIVPLQIGDNYAHERFLNLPLIFFCLLAAFGLWELHERGRALSLPLRRLAIGLVTVFWLALSLLNLHLTIPFWRDNLSLWTLAIMRDPDGHMAQSNLQAAYVNAGLYQQAIDYSEELVRRRNGQLVFDQVENYMLAKVALGQSVADLVPPMLDLLRSVGPMRGSNEFANIYANLAWAALSEGQLEQARESYREALRLSPQHPLANYGMALVAAASGDMEQAQTYLDVWRRYAHPTTAPMLRANFSNTARNIKNIASRQSAEKRQ